MGLTQPITRYRQIAPWAAAALYQYVTQYQKEYYTHLCTVKWLLPDTTESNMKSLENIKFIY